MKYSLRDFMPLMVIFAIILSFTAIRQYMLGYFDWMYAMNDFMGAFFIVFGTFKVINIHGFVSAYRIYDIVAQRSIIYAYIYPFIELSLGAAYILKLMPLLTNIITLIVMLVSSIGVGIELSKKKEIMCGCLGDVFKIPMTYVTLLEDVLMAFMALIMIVYLIF